MVSQMETARLLLTMVLVFFPQGKDVVALYTESLGVGRSSALGRT